MQRTQRIFLTLVFFLALFPFTTLAWRIIPGQVVPVMMEVNPDTAAASDIVSVAGFGLGASVVRDVFLCDNHHVYRAEIVEQTATLIRFRVPGNVSSGRMRLAAAVAGRAELVEQDVFLTIVSSPDDRPSGVPPLPTGL